ncbi:hypothetical protein M9H77_30583 [Catharanthus roseus]|uniref:Uncharacterized protein n=1 Tax=Catharanthus roseus TaxID=4058 RepID=A0ACB9ZY19_CATRO|nr:hypothetical protein M9H77_30583 [Catharanthus roseus]
MNFLANDLFKGIDTRMNPFKGGVDGMTLDVQGTVELLQRLVIRAMARRIEGEYQGKIAIFKEMIQDFSWQVIGAQEENFRGSKTFLFSSVQVQESKQASLGSLEA